MRLVVHPGRIKSKSDEDIHYITFHMLCSLYKIDPRKAVNGSDERYRAQEGDKHYYPRYDGSYWDHREE